MRIIPHANGFLIYLGGGELHVFLSHHLDSGP